jgi:hypothetical protein
MPMSEAVSFIDILRVAADEYTVSLSPSRHLSHHHH